MRSILKVGVALCLLILASCSSDSSEINNEAERMLTQFGELQSYFTETGIQGLLDYEDTGMPVSLVQLMSIDDEDSFARYESEASALWQSIGASERFRSEMFDQIVGERGLNQTRIIEFPNIAVLLSAIDTPTFKELMNTLASASSDHAWVLGEEQELPFTPGGSYFDPALQGLDRNAAIALLISQLGDSANQDDPNSQNADAVIDMLVSDAPSPFWMVNLIDFYDVAQFPDGRDTELSGKEANDIYGGFILPVLNYYNSLPEFNMPVSVVLTLEEFQWEQVSIPRYASRDAFLNAFVLNPSVDEGLEYKWAGVENTLVYPSEVPGTVLPAPETGFLFNYRYCEVLLALPIPDSLRADVYNSIPLSDCPQETWDALDADQIAMDYGADTASLNGIRYWVLDLIESNVPLGPPVIENFGGIPMRLAASVEVGEVIDGEASPYVANRVSRDTVFHYVAGRQVYELEDPEGTRFRMQSFTQGVDRNQQLVDLQRLGQRLELPPGWSFHVSLEDEDFELLTVDGIAEVIVDDLGNTYQRIP
jgi:uncharacterized protein (DUF1330 family)